VYIEGALCLGMEDGTMHIREREKTLYIKIKDENSSIKNTRQMRAQVDTTQKNKTKANDQ
jgi:hypothetical protein